MTVPAAAIPLATAIGASLLQTRQESRREQEQSVRQSSEVILGLMKAGLVSPKALEDSSLPGLPAFSPQWTKILSQYIVQPNKSVDITTLLSGGGGIVPPQPQQGTPTFRAPETRTGVEPLSVRPPAPSTGVPEGAPPAAAPRFRVTGATGSLEAGKPATIQAEVDRTPLLARAGIDLISWLSLMRSNGAPLSPSGLQTKMLELQALYGLQEKEMDSLVDNMSEARAAELVGVYQQAGVPPSWENIAAQLTAETGKVPQSVVNAGGLQRARDPFERWAQAQTLGIPFQQLNPETQNVLIERWNREQEQREIRVAGGKAAVTTRVEQTLEKPFLTGEVKAWSFRELGLMPEHITPQVAKRATEALVKQDLNKSFLKPLSVEDLSKAPPIVRSRLAQIETPTHRDWLDEMAKGNILDQKERQDLSEIDKARKIITELDELSRRVNVYEGLPGRLWPAIEGLSGTGDVAKLKKALANFPVVGRAALDLVQMSDADRDMLMASMINVTTAKDVRDWVFTQWYDLLVGTERVILGMKTSEDFQNDVYGMLLKYEELSGTRTDMTDENRQRGSLSLQRQNVEARTELDKIINQTQ